MYIYMLISFKIFPILHTDSRMVRSQIRVRGAATASATQRHQGHFLAIWAAVVRRLGLKHEARGISVQSEWI